MIEDEGRMEFRNESDQPPSVETSARIMSDNGKTGADELSRGTVLSVRGSVIDAHFPSQLPPLNQRLTATSERGSITVEVVVHLDPSFPVAHG